MDSLNVVEQSSSTASNTQAEAPLTKQQSSTGLLHKMPIFLKLVLRRLFWFLVFVCGVIIVVSAALGVQYAKLPTYSAADSRSCFLSVGDYMLSGERMYFYEYREVFGYRIIEVDTITEATMYELDGPQVTVVGIGTDWFSTKHELGEAGKRPLADAMSYTFIVDGVPAVTSYADFCE